MLIVAIQLHLTGHRDFAWLTVLSLRSYGEKGFGS